MTDKSIEQIQQEIEDLRAQLKAVEKEQARVAQARRDAVKIERRYTLAPVENPRRYHKLFDPTLHWVYLKGEVVNYEEARAAGHSERDLATGGMAYLFNAGTGLLVMSSGGGNIYVAGFPSDAPTEEDERVMRELSRFLSRYPEGGDITDIVVRHRAIKQAMREAERAGR